MKKVGKVLKREKGVSQMYAEAVNEIRSLLPENKSVTDDVVERAADILLDKGDLRHAPIPIISLCKNLGFKVYMQELPSKICGYIMISGELKENFNTDRIISVNQAESAKRRRFTVAHELGHFLFNFDPSRSIEFYNAFERDGEISEEEDTCNHFAAKLLMPKDIFREAYQRVSAEYKESDAYYNIVQQLSEEFLVPPKAVELRLTKELQLTEG